MIGNFDIVGGHRPPLQLDFLGAARDPIYRSPKAKYAENSSKLRVRLALVQLC